MAVTELKQKLNQSNITLNESLLKLIKTNTGLLASYCGEDNDSLMAIAGVAWCLDESEEIDSAVDTQFALNALADVIDTWDSDTFNAALIQAVVISAVLAEEDEKPGFEAAFFELFNSLALEQRLEILVETLERNAELLLSRLNLLNKWIDDDTIWQALFLKLLNQTGDESCELELLGRLLLSEVGNRTPMLQLVIGEYYLTTNKDTHAEEIEVVKGQQKLAMLCKALADKIGEDEFVNYFSELTKAHFPEIPAEQIANVAYFIRYQLSHYLSPERHTALTEKLSDISPELRASSGSDKCDCFISSISSTTSSVTSSTEGRSLTERMNALIELTEKLLGTVSHLRAENSSLRHSLSAHSTGTKSLKPVTPGRYTTPTPACLSPSRLAFSARTPGQKALASVLTFAEDNGTPTRRLSIRDLTQTPWKASASPTPSPKTMAWHKLITKPDSLQNEILDLVLNNRSYLISLKIPHISCLIRVIWPWQKPETPLPDTAIDIAPELLQDQIELLKSNEDLLFEWLTQAVFAIALVRGSDKSHEQLKQLFTELTPTQQINCLITITKNSSAYPYKEIELLDTLLTGIELDASLSQNALVGVANTGHFLQLACLLACDAINKNVGLLKTIFSQVYQQICKQSFQQSCQNNGSFHKLRGLITLLSDESRLGQSAFVDFFLEQFESNLEQSRLNKDCALYQVFIALLDTDLPNALGLRLAKKMIDELDAIVSKNKENKRLAVFVELIKTLYGQRSDIKKSHNLQPVIARREPDSPSRLDRKQVSTTKTKETGTQIEPGPASTAAKSAVPSSPIQPAPSFFSTAKAKRATASTAIGATMFGAGVASCINIGIKAGLTGLLTLNCALIGAAALIGLCLMAYGIYKLTHNTQDKLTV